MGVVIVEVHKSMPVGSKSLRWSNQHLFEGQVTYGQYDALNDFALRVANFEAHFHSTRVHFEYVNIGDYGQTMAETSGTHQHGVSLMHMSMTGIREIEDPAPPEYALYVKKVAPKGRAGRAFFFGCLDKSHYTEGTDGVPHFTAQTHFDYLFGDAMILYIEQLVLNSVIATSPTIFPDGMPFRPFTWHMGHVAKANAMLRKIGTRDATMEEIYSLIVATAQKASSAMRTLNFWRHEGHDFVPKEVKGPVMEAVSAITAIQDKVQAKFKNGEPARDGKYFRPIMRFGPQNMQIDNFIIKAEERREQRMEDLGKVQPILFPPDQIEYFTHDQTEMLEDMLKPVLSEYSEMLQADWKTDLFEEVS